MLDDLLSKLEAAHRVISAAERAAGQAAILVYSGKGAEHVARLAHCARMKAALAVARADAAAIRAEIAAVGMSAHERMRLQSIVIRGLVQ